MKPRCPWSLGVMLLAASASSCGRSDSASGYPKRSPSGGYGSGYGAPVGRFVDDAKTNTQLDTDALALSFVSTGGTTVNLRDFRGSKNVVLVFTRGFPGFVCPNCSTQTSRLIANYDEFVQRDTEVVFVFPGDKSHLDEFLKSSKPAESYHKPVPFPIMLDQGFQAVDKLKIREDLAKPSTFILDKEGQVRFAYVGANSGDRPSIKALLSQLDAIQESAKE